MSILLGARRRAREVQNSRARPERRAPGGGWRRYCREWQDVLRIPALP
jgi:hypothetical protein